MKATEQNDKLKRAIILSIALHCVLIAVLIWSSIHQPQETSAGSGGSSLNAVMVDPGAVVQQYNRQQQQQTDAQRAKQAQQQAEALQQKQAAEQQRLKVLEKQRLAAQEAEQQKQAQAEAEAKKAAAAKQSSELDELLGGLTNDKNAPKSGGAPAGTGNSKLSSATGSEINGYLAQVRQAISNKFYDASNYSRKTCILRIKLAPDGMLISVSSDGGDPALCQAAVSAAKLAAIPRPPSPKGYEAVKNATLDFKP